MQIVVLGMHRSGTSALTRVINLMGAYVGPESVTTPATAENPTGFWERQDVRALCDSILLGSGVDWWRPGQFDPLSVSEAVRDSAIEQWRSIASDLDPHQPWVVKEPRLCLVLPVLHPALDSPVAVHAHREPLEVASSLRARNGFPMNVGLALWEHYTVSALHGSAGLPRTHVWYGDLLADTDGTLDRLQRALTDFGVKGLERAPAEVLAGFLTPQLHRQRLSASERRQHLTLAQQDLLTVLEESDAPGSNAVEVSAGATETLQAFAEHRLRAEELQRDLRERVKDVSRLERAQAKHDAAESRRAEAEALRLERLESGLRNARAELAALAEDRASAQKQEQAYGALRSDFDRLKSDYLRLRRRRSVRIGLALAKLARPVAHMGRRDRAA